MSKLHIFHHTDSDGYLAGYLAQDFDKNIECVFHPINYGWNFPIDDIDESDKVAIVDFSLPIDTMRELVNKINDTNDILWIDHHVSAIDNYLENGSDILDKVQGIRIVGLSASMLAWIYFRCMSLPNTIAEFNGMANAAPYVVKLVNDHDIWTYKYKDDTSNFQTYLTSIDSSPNSSFWNQFDFNPVEFPDSSRDEVNTYLSAGKYMNEYRKSFNEKYVKGYAFPVQFEGYNCMAVNLGFTNSSVFDSIPGDYDMYITFSYSGRSKIWSYSLYSDKVDVSKIALKYGGGGHKGAAGFRSAELLIK